MAKQNTGKETVFGGDSSSDVSAATPPSGQVRWVTRDQADASRGLIGCPVEALTNWRPIGLSGNEVIRGRLVVPI